MHPDPAWPFLSMPHHPMLSAAWAVLIHGVVAVAAVAPILWRSGRRVLYGVLVFVGASLVDLDHFVAAGTSDLHRIETMNGRPGTHGLWVAVLVAALAWLISRRGTVAWCVFAVITSHLVFDAAGGGTPLLAPLSSIDAIPWLLCPVVVLALAAVSAATRKDGPFRLLGSAVHTRAGNERERRVVVRKLLAAQLLLRQPEQKRN
jgi:hypothetical protein